MAESYYKTIDGKKYDREMLKIAEESVAGKGDGRISVADAEKLYEAIIDGNTITEIEQETLDYIKTNFNITEAANKWLTEALEVWTAQKIAQKETVVHTTRRVSKTTKAAPVKSSQPAQTPSVILPAVIVVLIILLPFGYFMGKRGVEVTEDPTLTKKIEELEASLQSRDQDLSLAKSEAERLKERIAKVESAPVIPAVQAAEKAGPGEDENLKIRRELATKMEKNLSQEFADSQIQFIQKNLLISFIPEQMFFDAGSAVLQPDLKKLLKQFFPRFIESLKNQDLEIAEIRVQGHSSSIWKYSKNNTDAYLNNLSLSIDRAEAALEFCLNLNEMKPQRAWLIDRLVSSGLSHNQPILDQDGQEDPIRSRRITIAIETASIDE